MSDEHSDSGKSAAPSKTRKTDGVPATTNRDAESDSRTLDLFQNFYGPVDSGDDQSNALDLWDAVPRYAISANRMNELRTPDGFLPVTDIPFRHRGRAVTARIYPAQVKQPDGTYKSYFAGAREEIVEHALRKLAAESGMGFLDSQGGRSGVVFTMYMLRQELARQNHAMSYEELARSLDILSLSAIELIAESENAQEFRRSNYLQALGGQRRANYDKDRTVRWTAQFHPLVTSAVQRIEYRQFNYSRLMQCKSQLARWLLNLLVLKYVQASPSVPFIMKFSTIERDSALLAGYKLKRQAMVAVNGALDELVQLEALTSFTTTVERGARNAVIDASYELMPSRAFVLEQKAANRRRSDALPNSSLA